MIRRIRTVRFRNLTDGELELGAPQVFLIGANGQGKSNLLEALYFLSYGSSFRGHSERQVVCSGQDAFAVAGEIEKDGLCESVQVRWEFQKKEIRLNERLIRDRKELLELHPCLLFSHEDFQLVQGGPEPQRQLLDQTSALSDPGALDVQRRYRQLLKSRNQLLKTRDLLSLDVYETQLIHWGLALMSQRQRTFEALKPIFEGLFSRVTGWEGLELAYAPSWKSRDPEELQSLIRERRDSDRQMGQTMLGPHRDRLRFQKDQRSFGERASTGQIRLMSLCLRAAQAQVFTRDRGRAPVLLLDDVLLELDPERRRRFFTELPLSEQRIFTFLPEEPLLSENRGDILRYRVESGTFERP